METSSLVKVIAAFVTGVFVALGGSLLYVKVADRNSSAPAVQTSATEPESASQKPAPAGPGSEARPDDDQPEANKQVPAMVNKPAIKKPALAAIGHKFTHRVSGQTSTPAVEIAKNDPPSQPAPAPQVPASAYPENQPEPAPAATPGPTPAGPPQPSSTPQEVPPPAVRQPQTVTLEPGTSLVVRLTEALSTEHNYSGDTFRGALELPIVMNGFIIAEKGSKVLGRVVNAQRAGRVEGLADLSLCLTEINTTDGQRVTVQTTTYEKQGSKSIKKDVAKVAGGAAVGAIIGGIAGGGAGAGIGAGIGGAAGAGDVLLTRGSAAVIPSETQLTFRLSSPVTITEKIN